jgi:hypothetical protein
MDTDERSSLCHTIAMIWVSPLWHFQSGSREEASISEVGIAAMDDRAAERLANRTRIGVMPIRRDSLWCMTNGSDRLPEKALGRILTDLKTLSRPFASRTDFCNTALERMLLVHDRKSSAFLKLKQSLP